MAVTVRRAERRVRGRTTSRGRRARTRPSGPSRKGGAGATSRRAVSSAAFVLACACTGGPGAVRAAWAGEVAASGLRGSGAGGRGAGLPCSVGACGRGGAELVRPGRSPGGGACSVRGVVGWSRRRRGRPSARGGREERKEEKKREKEKENGKREMEGEKEREIRAEITASIAEPVGRVPRSPACADEATGKRGRNAGDWLIGTGKDSGN